MRATSKLQHVEVPHPPATQAGWSCPQDGLARAPSRLISYTRSERDTREPPSPDVCLALIISGNRTAEWIAGILRHCRHAIKEFHT
jgi:hypothetical protein